MADFIDIVDEQLIALVFGSIGGIGMYYITQKFDRWRKCDERLRDYVLDRFQEISKYTQEFETDLEQLLCTPASAPGDFHEKRKDLFSRLTRIENEIEQLKSLLKYPDLQVLSTRFGELHEEVIDEALVLVQVKPPGFLLSDPKLKKIRKCWERWHSEMHCLTVRCITEKQKLRDFPRQSKNA